VLDKYGEILGQRAELKKAWEEIAALAWNNPEAIEAIQKLDRNQRPAREKVDYIKCLNKIAEFRSKLLLPQRNVLGAELFKQLDTTLAAFSRLVESLASDILVNTRLAQF